MNPKRLWEKYLPLLAMGVLPAFYIWLMFKDPKRLDEIMRRAARAKELKMRLDEVVGVFKRLEARWLATLEEPTVNQDLEEEIARHFGLCYGTARALCEVDIVAERGFKAWYRACNAGNRSKLVLDVQKYAEMMAPIFWAELEKKR